MAYSLHTTKVYKKEYGRNAINGWADIDKFINYLRERNRNGADIYINEEENEIDIPFSELEEMKSDVRWGATAEIILENSDKDNAEAHLEIW